MRLSFPSRRGAAMLLLASLCLSPAFAQAPAYPSKPIRLIVGFSAGGGVDAMARLLAPRLSEQLGQQVIVENRAGAGGLIAGDAVAKAAPDGYTLLLGESGILIAQFLQAKMPFDPLRSFAPVAGVFTVPVVIVANNSFPARTPKEFVALLKANPGKYAYATPGVGTVQYLGFEMFKAEVGAFVVHIPYRGAAQVLPDVIGGQVPLAVVSAAAGIAQAKAGKVRAVAFLNEGKVSGAEDVPALADALPGFNVAPRIYLLAPAATPAAVVDRLGQAVRTVLASGDLVQAASALGVVSEFVPAATLATDLARESASWGKIIKNLNLRPE